MIEVRYPKGHVAYQTMTVGELRAALSKFPDDLPVVAGWEGIQVPITEDRLSVGESGYGVPGDPERSLIIDADNY